MACEVAYGTAIAEFHFHEAAPWRGGIHKLSVGDELHALLCSAHFRVRHPRIGMAGLEGDSAIHQRQRDDVLAVDIWHRAVVDDAGPVLRNSYYDSVYAALVQAVL